MIYFHANILHVSVVNRFIKNHNKTNGRSLNGFAIILEVLHMWVWYMTRVVTL